MVLWIEQQDPTYSRLCHWAIAPDQCFSFHLPLPPPLFFLFYFLCTFLFELRLQLRYMTAAITLSFVSVCVHACVIYMCEHTGATALVWRSEDNAVAWLLPFHLYLGLGIEFGLSDLHSKCGATLWVPAPLFETRLSIESSPQPPTIRGNIFSTDTILRIKPKAFFMLSKHAISSLTSLDLPHFFVSYSETRSCQVAQTGLECGNPLASAPQIDGIASMHLHAWPLYFSIQLINLLMDFL